ncbi:MAG TPA: XRE family transcriptional regulator, partial [Desulfobulbus sp.]|nr:XRE family transcriptional regulator [Desulfobulbus sp.]
MTIEEIIARMGLQMRKARQLRNDRQKDLAARMGVSRLTVMKMEKGGAEAGRIPLETWLRAAYHLDLLDTWQEVMVVRTDPFEEYDRKIREEERIRKARVKKPG